MIIDLANVVPRPKAIEIAFSPNEIDLDVDGTRLTTDVAFRGETERVEGKAHVRGTIGAECTVDCTRCLDPISKVLDISFDDVFIDPVDEPDETEVVLDAEQLDESIAEDGKVDLAEVVREQILLALPDQLFCREDCKGLCPQCGGNRNLIDCKCEENETDPRWSALKDFR
jgi:uncharacterized protein